MLVLVSKTNKVCLFVECLWKQAYWVCIYYILLYIIYILTFGIGLYIGSYNQPILILGNWLIVIRKLLVNSNRYMFVVVASER